MHMDWGTHIGKMERRLHPSVVARSKLSLFIDPQVDSRVGIVIYQQLRGREWM